MTCLIAGASGLVGGELLKILLSDSHFEKIISLARRALPINNEKLVQITTSLEKVESFILPPTEVAFCCLGTTIKKAGSQEEFRKVDYDYVIHFARAAKKAGVKKFILVSAIGADANSTFFYNKVKGETEETLKKLGFASLIILQPSLLLGNRAEQRPLEKAFITASPVVNHLLIGPLGKYKAVQAETVAKCMLEKSLASNPTVLVVSNQEILNA